MSRENPQMKRTTPFIFECNITEYKSKPVVSRKSSVLDFKPVWLEISQRFTRLGLVVIGPTRTHAPQSRSSVPFFIIASSRGARSPVCADGYT